MRRRDFVGLSCKRGAAAIEFAVVLPLLMLLAFGLIDIGRAVWTQATLNYAAQATARCFAIGSSSCSTAALAQAYGASQAYGMNLTCTGGTGSQCVTASKTTCNGQNAAQAQVNETFGYIFPFFRHFSGTFAGTACYPI